MGRHFGFLTVDVAATSHGHGAMETGRMTPKAHAGCSNVLRHLVTAQGNQSEGLLNWFSNGWTWKKTFSRSCEP